MKYSGRSVMWQSLLASFRSSRICIVQVSGGEVLVMFPLVLLLLKVFL